MLFMIASGTAMAAVDQMGDHEDSSDSHWTWLFIIGYLIWGIWSSNNYRIKKDEERKRWEQFEREARENSKNLNEKRQDK